MKKHTAPLIAAILLILPVLYLGGYFALVHPNHEAVWQTNSGVLRLEYDHYRWGGRASALVFWPLEQIDRKVRPAKWAVVQEWLSYPPTDLKPGAVSGASR